MDKRIYKKNYFSRIKEIFKISYITIKQVTPTAAAFGVSYFKISYITIKQETIQRHHIAKKFQNILYYY